MIISITVHPMLHISEYLSFDEYLKIHVTFHCFLKSKLFHSGDKIKQKWVLLNLHTLNLLLQRIIKIKLLLWDNQDGQLPSRVMEFLKMF